MNPVIDGAVENKKNSPRAVKKRKAIMDAAWLVFAEHGYERASMEAIVARCGGSKATIYSYFSSKADLFQQVSLAKAAELSAVAFGGLNEAGDLRQALYDFGLRYLSFYLNPDLIEVFRLASAEGKSLRFGAILYEKNFRPCWGRVAAFLEKRIPRERLLPGGGWTAAMHLRSLLDGDALMKKSWGIMGDASSQDYEEKTSVAVQAFLRIYMPEAS